MYRDRTDVWAVLCPSLCISKGNSTSVPNNLFIGQFANIIHGAIITARIVTSEKTRSVLGSYLRKVFNVSADPVVSSRKPTTLTIHNYSKNK